MPATQSYDRAAERRLAKQLAAADVDASDVPPGGSPAGDRFRRLVSPHKRIRVLRNAIHRTGRINYLVRFGQTDQWKAVIGGQPYGGTFNQVLDQIAHLVIHHVEA